MCHHVENHVPVSCLGTHSESYRIKPEVSLDNFSSEGVFLF